MQTTKPGCGNPLLLEFLKEMMEKEATRGTNSSKGYYVLKKAYDSMKICPLPFNHPSEAACLKGIGPNICKRLETRLEAHCKANGLVMPPHPSQTIVPEEDDDQLQSSQLQSQSQEVSKRKARVTKTKTYVPAKRSGPYALLRALGSLADDQSINKAELIRLAAPFSDSSFDIPTEKSRYYTAWHGMKILEQKNLVYKNGNPARYCLTEEGIETCRKIEEAEATINNLEYTSGPVTGSSTNESLPTADRSMFKKTSETRINTEELIVKDVCVSLQGKSSLGPKDYVGSDDDLSRNISTATKTTIEPASSRNRPTSLNLGLEAAPVRPDAAPREPIPLSPNLSEQSAPQSLSSTCQSLPNDASKLPSSYIPAGRYTVQIVVDVREVRSERERKLFVEGLEQSGIDVFVRSLDIGDILWIAKDSLDGQEYILDYIVERKRMDDLVSSIKDGRFHEQKFRLTKSGIKQIIYVIEETNMDKLSSYREAIETAISSSQVQNGFFVKRVPNIEGTVTYLCRLSKQLKQLYSTESLHIIPSCQVSSRNYHTLRSDLRRDDPNKRYTIPLSDFAQITSKNGALTLADIFLKMLLTIRGVSAEKAIEIQKVFPTPRHLLDSYNSCRDEMDKKMLIAKSIQGYGRKSIGNALSEKIYGIWGK
ncbi:Crossover junction endonuclease mus81 [Neolecta irregularis DAH-3]|uniref:Crossover junction endonuclease MUS81 n=1 Tax=Neolecta irregularis (strain DAH-3) TaxID=1198029 RepID=A0A1U7LLB4_NEOID|nr:Crossover junction endonuclease mus81 [Neolecta irregularis DAH-3]|eukprot:OLL23383.1 Crossover junction endonuclease mus81 [Neolecta irregularis DAH-3]